MALRKTILATGEVYHIFNRATEKRVIFTTRREYQRFIDLIRFYRSRRKAKFSSVGDGERQALIDQKDVPATEEVFSIT